MCVCVHARVRVCACACVHACVYVYNTINLSIVLKTVWPFFIFQLSASDIGIATYIAMEAGKEAALCVSAIGSTFKKTASTSKQAWRNDAKLIL